MVQRVVLFLFVLSAALGLSCSEIRHPVLTVTTTTSELSPGKVAQLTVTRQFPGGGPIEVVTDDVAYSVFPHDVIAVSSAGLVTTGPELGTAEVRISDPKNEAATTIRFTVTATRIVTLKLDVDALIELEPGSQRRLGAVATMSNDETLNVTTSMLWDSSNADVATVGQTQGDIGNVTAKASGQTTITATDPVTNIQARTVVLVRGDPPQLAAITITPNPVSIGLGAPFPLTAVGVYTNGQTENVTRTSTWSSSDPNVATVDANGVVLGISAGAATITAAGPAELIKGSTAVTIE